MNQFNRSWKPVNHNLVLQAFKTHNNVIKSITFMEIASLPHPTLSIIKSCFLIFGKRNFMLTKPN